MNPMWQIQATDGMAYYVGPDRKVYVYADSPSRQLTSNAVSKLSCL